ncbi:MAG TPA: VOC family protein [Candidatus Acidoferrales bacterium]|nr:VOC family protein [Candidatus Acidoferrales bacterium]
MLIPVEGLFEAHLVVQDVPRSIAFYRDVVGLELALSDPQRPAAFFWLGGRCRTMLGLFSPSAFAAALGTSPQFMQQHLAFRVQLEDLLAAPQRLRSAGITPWNNRRNPVDEPIVFAWMPAASLFFADPDGHLLEYISILPGPPRPELGVLSWSAWQRIP